MSKPQRRARRLGRAERREQILIAATRAFTHEGGYADTGLDDVAREAGVTRVILYRHFESKRDLYQAAIDRSAADLHSAATDEHGELTEDSVPAMVAWASRDPDAYRLLFRHALREPEFRDDVEQLRASMVAALGSRLDTSRPDNPWARWVAQLATTTVLEGILAWLDQGSPDPAEAARHILDAVDGVFQALH